MSKKRDALGDRMKQYEDISRHYLTRKIPVIIRVDGKAFHTFTKGFAKPFDHILMQAMQVTMGYLCKNIQGCVLGYTQSDEITLVVTDYANIDTDAWFGYNLQKMASIAASMATFAFNTYMRALVLDDSEMGALSPAMYNTYINALEKGALFDARAWSLPKEEVVNCLIWRQQDATRNSIQAAAQARYSHKQLMNKNTSQLQDMLMEDGINWNNYSTSEKRGSCCVKKQYSITDLNTYTGELTSVTRTQWVIDDNIPIFTQNREYIESRL